MLESPLGTVEQQVCGGAPRARPGCGRPYPNTKRRAGAVPAHAALGAGRPRRIGQRGRALWRARHPLRGRPGAQGPRVFGQQPAGAPPRSGQARGMLMAWPASTLTRACGRIPVRGSGLLRWGTRRRLLVLCFCCIYARRQYQSMQRSLRASAPRAPRRSSSAAATGSPRTGCCASRRRATAPRSACTPRCAPAAAPARGARPGLPTVLASGVEGGARTCHPSVKQE